MPGPTPAYEGVVEEDWLAIDREDPAKAAMIDIDQLGGNEMRVVCGGAGIVSLRKERGFVGWW